MQSRATEAPTLTVPGNPCCPHCGQRLIDGAWGISLDVAYCSECRSLDFSDRLETARAIQRQPVASLLHRQHGITWYLPRPTDLPPRLFPDIDVIPYAQHPYYRSTQRASVKHPIRPQLASRHHA